jgi:hypothetical protein
VKLPSAHGARPNLQMRNSGPIKLLFGSCAAFLLSAGQLVAQLPATAPTSLPAQNALPAPISGTPVAGEYAHSPHRASVYFTDGMLDVRADDSSLLQILHDISRRTGMTITGGVADQRVFGNYGPAAPATVLATLLDGTGTNMLLKETPGDDKPVELVLTQRTGGASPPNPNAAGMDDSPLDDPTPRAPLPPNQPPPPMGFRGQAQSPLFPTAQPANPNQPRANQTPAPGDGTPPVASTPQPPVGAGTRPVAQPLNNPLGNPANQTPSASQLNTTNSVPISAIPTPSTATPAPQGIVDTPNPPPAGSTSNASGTTTPVPGSAAPVPGTAATPEQIYQQLLQIQAANAAAARSAQPANAQPAPAQPAPTPQ